MSSGPRSWGRTASTRACGLTFVLALLTIASVLTPGARAPPLPPLEAFGHALNAAAAPLPVGTAVRAFIDGVRYSNLSAVVSPDGSYSLEVVGNSYTGSSSDTPTIKEGGDPGDLVVFASGDLTASGSLFRESAAWQPGAVVSTDLREASGAKQPILLKIDAIVTRPADARTQYAFLCNPTIATADLSRYYLQKDIPGSMNGPTIALSGLVPGGTRYYVDFGSSSYLATGGDAFKLVWRNPRGADAPARGSDVVVDRVELNATSGGTLFWEPGNTILSDAPAPGVGQEIHRSPSCADTDRGSDFVVASESPRLRVPAVDLLSPRGGEDWTGGSVHQVPYTIADTLDTSLLVRVELSTDSGLTYPTIIDGPTSRQVGSQSFPWTVSVIDTSTARIRVCATNTQPLTNCSASRVDFAIDSTAPRILALRPPSGATDVRLNEPVRVIFSEAMARSSAEAAVTVTPSPGPPTFSWSPRNDTLTVDHPDFPTVQSVLVSVATTARDASDPGNALAAPASSSFITSDNAPPQATVTGPAGCLSGGFPSLVTWAMSDPETPAGQLVVYANYTSSMGGGPIVGPVTGAVSATWQPPTSLTAADVRIGVQVFDPRGANRTAVGAPFEVDSTPPVVVSTVPVTGTAGLSRSQPISVLFSEAMNRSATEAAVQITPAIPIGFAWSNATLIVQHVPLVYNTTYTLTIGATARDDCSPGTLLASPVSIVFATVANGPPSLSIQAPTGGGAYEPGASLRIVWNMSDDHTSADALVVFVNYTSATGNGTIASGRGLMNTTWSISSIDASDVRIEVTVIDDGGLAVKARTNPFSVHARGFVWTDYLWIAVVVASVVVLVVILLFGRGKGRKPEAGPPTGPPIAAPPRPTPPAAEPTPPGPAFKECPSCHTQVRVEDRFCFFCGHVF